MTRLEEKATEFAKTEFHRPYSDTPEEAIVIVEPDKYNGFIGGYKEALEDVRKEVESMKKGVQSIKIDSDFNEGKLIMSDDILFFIDGLTK